MEIETWVIIKIEKKKKTNNKDYETVGINNKQKKKREKVKR